MHYRSLGQGGLTVSALGLGTMDMTMACGPADEQEGIATIRRAYELGVTFFDTAELYGQGTGSNEESRHRFRPVFSTRPRLPDGDRQVGWRERRRRHAPIARSPLAG